MNSTPGDNVNSTPGDDMPVTTRHQQPAAAGARSRLSRRTVLRSGLAATAVPLMVPALAGARPAFAQPSDPPGSRSRLRLGGQSPASTADTLQRVTGHALYLLPQDHKWHTGGIFDSGQIQEWHYWTGFFTDDDTGEQFGIFYNITNNPSAPGGPSLWQQGVSFSFGDFAKQELIWSHQPTAVGSLQATRPPDSTSPDDFQYNAKGDERGIHDGVPCRA